MNLKIFFFLITATVSAQSHIYFSAGFDIKNTINGSKATENKASIDILLKFGMISKNNFEITINDEYFKRLNFNKFSFGIGYGIPLTEKIIIVPTIEPSIISRWNDWGGGLGYIDNPSSHLSLGASLPLRYSINDSWDIELETNLLFRTDLNAKYTPDKIPLVFSNFLNIIYKIGLN